MRRGLLLLLLLIVVAPARAATITDATGRSVAVPDHVARVLPAGPPAAVLLAALAPDLMIGWPGSPPADAASWLTAQLASLPAVPRLTGQEDATVSVAALHPDLILDYGDVSPRYTRLAADTQARTGVPTILLDGALPALPDVLRGLGAVLGRTARAEVLASAAEVLLREATPGAGKRVAYARAAADGLLLAGPGTAAVQVLELAGATVVAPPGEGTVRPVTAAALEALHPDVLLLHSPDALAVSLRWTGVSAARVLVPATPFGWIEEPPSINRLIGLGAIEGGSPALMQALLFGRAPASGAWEQPGLRELVR